MLDEKALTTRRRPYLDLISNYLSKTATCSDFFHIALNLESTVAQVLDLPMLAIFVIREGVLTRLTPLMSASIEYSMPAEGATYLAQRVIQENKILQCQISDYADSDTLASLSALGGISTVSIPIHYNEEVIGAISLVLETRKTLTADELWFCDTLTQYIGPQLKSALLIEQTAQQFAEKERVEFDLNMIFNQCIDLICVLSANGIIKRISPNFVKRFGYEAEKVIGHPATEYIYYEDLDLAGYVLEHVKEKIVIQGHCHRFMSHEGKIISLELNVQYIRKTDCILIVGRDVSDQVEYEKRNLELERSVALERMKTELFSNVSHEFKTPINIILSSIDLLKLKMTMNDAENYENQYARYLHYTEQNCYKLLRLVTNLLDSTKIQNDALQMFPTRCDIISFIQYVVKCSETFALSRGLTLSFHTPLTEPCPLNCDPDKVDRILLNLISNSINHTANGGKIDVTLWEDPDFVFISVKDTGEGIPQECMPHIFEKFKVCASNYLNSTAGTGLGLSIVKGLVELHRGTVSVTSELGKSCTFTFSLSKNLRRKSGESDVDMNLQEDGSVRKSRVKMEMSYLE